jgi:acyl carrier protein
MTSGVNAFAYVAHGGPCCVASDGHKPNRLVALRLHGLLDVDALQRTLANILSRHYILSEGRIHSDVCLLRMTPGSADPKARSAWIETVARDEVLRPFRAADALLRVLLLRFAEEAGEDDESVVLFVLDAAVADEWSMALLKHEFQLLYTAFRNAAPDPLPPLTMQYADCVKLASADMAHNQQADALLYWLAQLAGHDTTASCEQRLPATMLNTTIGAGLRSKLMAVARSYGSGLFALLYAAFAVLLHRSDGRSDVLIGVPVSGRLQLEFEVIIGRFSRLLPLRSHLSGDLSFAEVLRLSHASLRDAYRHQDVSLPALREAWDGAHPGIAMPVPPACFYMCEPEQVCVELPDVQASLMENVCPYTDCPLELRVFDSSAGLGLRWTFATEMSTVAEVEAMSEEFMNLLHGIACQPTRAIATLDQPVIGDDVAVIHTSPTIGATLTSRVSAPPATPNERVLARLWADNLHVDEAQIGVTDNYFDLGGDSLRTISLAATIRSAFQASVSIADIFSYPTIQQMARHIAGGGRTSPQRSDVTDSKSRILLARKRMQN